MTTTIIYRDVHSVTFTVVENGLLLKAFHIFKHPVVMLRATGLGIRALDLSFQVTGHPALCLYSSTKVQQLVLEKEKLLSK